MSGLTVVERPNGKLYRARKVPFTVLIENDHMGETEILVLRTHDVDLACVLARVEARRYGVDWQEPVPHTVSWSRKSIRNHEPWWEFDDVRGMPCVVFHPERAS